MQIRNYSDDQIQKAEGSDVSEIRLTGRAARSIPHPLGWGGRAQFDLLISNTPVLDRSLREIQ